ncbi:hypothetical protein MKW92_024720, partial [Papaver armeniacum]
RGKWLGMVTSDYNLIAVIGTHGKSTTSAMLAYVLKVFSLLFLLAQNLIPGSFLRPKS